MGEGPPVPRLLRHGVRIPVTSCRWWDSEGEGCVQGGHGMAGGGLGVRVVTFINPELPQGCLPTTRPPLPFPARVN